PVRRRGVDGPDLARGGTGLGIARTVEADEADDLVAVDRHLDLGLAVLDGLAPVGLALFHRGHGFQLIVWHEPAVGLQGGGSVDLGDVLGIAKRGWANLDTGHGRTKTGDKGKPGIFPQTDTKAPGRSVGAHSTGYCRLNWTRRPGLRYRWRR